MVPVGNRPFRQTRMRDQAAAAVAARGAGTEATAVGAAGAGAGSAAGGVVPTAFRPPTRRIERATA